jgi:bifunctional non-homologous end joining protein LigD
MSTRKAKWVLVFMGKFDSTRPGPALFICHVVASRRLPRLLRALSTQPSREAAHRACRVTLKAASCLIDGEAVACGDDGLPVFDRLRARRDDRHVFLYAFDLIGEDLRREPIERRKAALAKLMRRATTGLVPNEHIDEPGDVVFRHACKLGLEGIVSKRLGSPYRSGRSWQWVKSKNPAAPAVRREAEEDWTR